VFDYVPFPVLTHTHTHNGDDTLPKVVVSLDVQKDKYSLQAT